MEKQEEEEKDRKERGSTIANSGLKLIQSWKIR